MKKERKKYFFAKILVGLIILLSFSVMSCESRANREAREKEIERIEKFSRIAVMFFYDRGYKDAEEKKSKEREPEKLATKEVPIEAVKILCEAYEMGYDDFLQRKPNVVQKYLDKLKENKDKTKEKEKPQEKEISI